MFAPKATTHPSLANGAWTKITTLEGDARKFLRVVNEDATNIIRLEFVGYGGAVPTLATEGFPLTKATAAGPDSAGIYEECGLKRSSGHVYAYNPAGAPVTTLAVTEGQ